MPGLLLTGEDYAENPGLSVTQLAEFLRDIDFQPAWRPRAEVDADYYDSNQLDSKALQLMESRGIPPIVVNLIAPTINLIVGMEAKTRRDWRVTSDDEDEVDLAAALTKELMAAERGAHADRACSDAYAAQVKAGLGWVHTYKQTTNPYAFPYASEYVHRREIWWDWHDNDLLLRNARWLCRRKWYDLDVLIAQWPDFRELFEQIVAGWSLFEDRMELDRAHPLFQDWMSQRDFTWSIDQWRNLDRKRLSIYEIWYRMWERRALLRMNDGKIVDLQKTPLHAQIIERKLGMVQISSVPRVRLSYWCGPHRLVDVPSPLPHEEFPYVPFWGYREDRTNIPYGHIRAMRPMQDEVNARRARMLWQLSARRLIGFGNMVQDKQAIEDEVARPDAAIWLNGQLAGSRTVDEVMRVDDNQGMNAQQFNAYEDAKNTLQDVASVFKEQLGKAGAADSGIAISQLIEQGTTGLAGLNSNYGYARTAVGNQLFALVKADIGKKERAVTIDKGLGQKKTVVLNKTEYDADADVNYRSNDVALTQARVVLDDVPSSPTYRQYQFKQLVELVRGLPNPQLQAAVIDMVVMSTDVPNREEIARRIRAALGIQETDPEKMSPEEQEAMLSKQEMEQFVAKMRETMALLAKERADLENQKLDAEVELTEAKAKVEEARVPQMHAQTDKLEVESERLEKEPIVDKADISPGADPKRMPLRDVA